jgi:hypothetical protein
MLDMALDNAIADHKTYGSVEAQHGMFAKLRREDPVHWTQPDGYRPFWTITKYADIIEIERQADRFINQPRTKLLSIEFESKIREAMSGKPMLVRALPQMDNPDHSKYQKLTHAWFQPRQLRTLADRMDALAKESVDRLCALGGACDFYNEIAIYYPLRVLMTILGLPREDEERLLKITQAYFGGGDPEMQKGNDLIDATMAYVEYFKDVARERRQNPKDDVATIIATSEIDGKPIGDFEAYSYYVALASAGHDTTSATIAGGLLALIENPDAMARCRLILISCRMRPRRWCAGCRRSSTSSGRRPWTTKFAARTSRPGIAFSSAILPAIATKKPSIARSNSFPIVRPTGISVSASGFMRASAGIWLRRKSWRSSGNCCGGSIASSLPGNRPGRKPRFWAG